MYSMSVVHTVHRGSTCLLYTFVATLSRVMQGWRPDVKTFPTSAATATPEYKKKVNDYFKWMDLDPMERFGDQIRHRLSVIQETYDVPESVRNDQFVVVARALGKKAWLTSLLYVVRCMHECLRLKTSSTSTQTGSCATATTSASLTETESKSLPTPTVLRSNGECSKEQPVSTLRRSRKSLTTPLPEFVPVAQLIEKPTMSVEQHKAILEAAKTLEDCYEFIPDTPPHEPWQLRRRNAMSAKEAEEAAKFAAEYKEREFARRMKRTLPPPSTVYGEPASPWDPIDNAYYHADMERQRERELAEEDKADLEREGERRELEKMRKKSKKAD